VKTFPHTLNLNIDERLSAAAELNEERSRAERLLQVLSWKQRLDVGFPLIVALVGGTGTGKSTLLNSLAGRSVSAVGIKRPCTLTAIVYVHQNWAKQLRNRPFFRRPKEVA
jgi:tRNA U34 5-carboxymethylaminomethyl modifying GTPase MnmE/TrmE